MKHFLFVFLSFSAFAEIDVLSIARDSYLKRAVVEMNDYCSKTRKDLPSDENYAEICRIQMRADCEHGPLEGRLLACQSYANIQKLEEMALLSDKNFRHVQPTPIGFTMIAPVIQSLPPVRETNLNFSSRVLNVNDLSDREWVAMGKPNKQTLQKTYGEWSNAQEEMNRFSFNRTCEEATDCTLQYYGAEGCVNGHEGALAIRKGDLPGGFTEALARYNEARSRAVKYDPFSCPAVMRSWVPTCVENQCQVLVID